MNKDEVYPTKENREEVQRVLKNIHNLHPAIVFYTLSGAHDIAVVLKEAYRNAYPSEKLPKFYSIRPRTDTVSGTFGRKFKKISKSMGIENENIVVYDECRGRPESVLYSGKHAPADYAREPITAYELDKIKHPHDYSALKKATKVVAELVGNQQRVYAVGTDNEKIKNGFMERRIYGRPEIDIKRVSYGAKGRKITNQLKQFGREIGEEIKQEAQRKKSLEQRVSGATAIFGLLSSFFFLSSSVTGNAIGNLEKSSGSWLGIGLLLVGIAAALFYFWSKKQ